MDLKIGLFIPCYIDQFYPQVGKASLELLKKLGCDVEYPMNQTCCGQPLANSGLEKLAIPAYDHFVKVFQTYDYIVAPSASCVYHVREHYVPLTQDEATSHVRKKTLDLVEFLVDVIKIESIASSFPFRVGLHQSCHGLRGLRMARSSELVAPGFSKWKYVLELVRDIHLVTLQNEDECCGFGGTFSIAEAPISAKMGTDRISDHMNAKAEYITSGDMSCLMHLEGLIKRQKKNIKVIHIAEILNGYESN